MESIKLGDLHLSKSALSDIVQLVAKKRHRGLSKQIER